MCQARIDATGTLHHIILRGITGGNLEIPECARFENVIFPAASSSKKPFLKSFFWFSSLFPSNDFSQIP